MQRTNHFLHYITLVGALLLLSGCRKSDQIPVYPVEGQVTFEGKPLEGGGSISFVPLANQPGKTAAGEIGPDGKYRLTTHSSGDGSMAGEFRVVIFQADEEPEATPDGVKPVAPPTPKRKLPEIYGDHNQSPLCATVEAKSVNQLDFNLKRK